MPKIKIIPFNQIANKGDSESSIIHQEKFKFFCSHGSQKTLNDHSIIFFINEIKIFYHFNETLEENNKNVFSEMFFDEIVDENENEFIFFLNKKNFRFFFLGIIVVQI